MSRFDVPKGELIAAVAAELQKMPACKPPAWAPFVKTGAHKQRAPVQDNWWFLRLASVLRRVSEVGPVGVSKLRKMYGGKRNKGFAPERTYPGSGNIARKVLQQLEKSGLVKQVGAGVHKGRKITSHGVKLLDSVAKVIMQKSGIVLPKKVVVEPVEKVEKKPRKPRAPRKKKAEAKPEAKPEVTEVKEGQ